MAMVKEKVLLDGFALPVDAMLSEEAKLVALCRPNNPTGNLLDRGDVVRILEESPGVVLLDEAYGDFCDSNMLREVLACEHGIDVRTFSKAYGIAGLRAGYAIARKEMVDELRRVRTPFGLNSFTEAIAIAALDHRDWVDAKVREMKAERSYLAGKMKELGFTVYPSDCNFLLCRSPVDSARLVDDLIEKGVAIRDFGGYPLLENHVRITIGPRGHVDTLLDALAPLMDGARS